MDKNDSLDILVIEDEMNATLLSEKIKKELKEDINIYTNGAGVKKDLEMYAKDNLDLIIIDQQYTGGDIVETLRTIRRKRPDAEVIILSSDASEKTENSLKEAGAFDFIYKDRTALDKVIYSIKSYLTQKRLRKENYKLKTTSRKSNLTITILVILAVIAIGILVYLLS